MRKTLALAFVCCLLAALAPAANLVITPTTTLSAETGNNTSASSSFPTANGNVAAGNVSKVDVRSLMYPGFNGPVFAHLMGWFGASNHMDIGYTSSDPAQAHKQVTDMMSRGINGIFQVWYGGGTEKSNLTALAIKNEAELHPGFTFMLAMDWGAVAWHSCYSTCTATQAVTQLTTYIANTYFSSPAYLRINGRPVISNFDIDLHYTVDWNYVAANTPGNPIFWFQNSSGLTHTQSAGAYSWVMPATTDYGMSYLAYFYGKALQYPSKTVLGAAYKGFDDTLASWTKNRIMGQQCGQTWLQTFAKANSYFSPAQPLSAMQLVTWNDYEEGTEIESGIDNCVSVSASLSGSVLNWTLSGDPSTLDHYTVYISTDGQNLMPLGDWGVDINQLDLATYSLDPGSYTLFVKAVGRPSMLNHMTAGVGYTVPNQPPTAALSLSASTVNVTQAVTASASASDIDGSVASTSINWGDGSASAGPSASHAYAMPGTYTVTVTATDNLGATGQASAIVTVNSPGPVAALAVSSTSGIAPVAVSASTADSSSPFGSIASSVINWGDGSSSAGPSASHSYANAGSYAVTATVTDNYGASSTTAAQTVSVQSPYVVISSPANGATVTSAVPVVAQAFDGRKIASMVVQVDWTKEYLIYAASLSTSIPMTPGAHTILVKAWEDVTGKIYQASVKVTVAAQAPSAALSLSATSGLAPVITSATVAAGDPNLNGSITATNINWGDGTSSTGAAASHTYAAAGRYTVAATVTDNYGMSATTSQQVSVTAPYVTITSPVAGATAGSPMRVTAQAFDGRPIASMMVYVDGVKQYLIYASSLDTYLAMTPGTHKLQVKAWEDVTGVIYQATITVNVPGVAIQSPSNGASSGSPVHFVAGAVGYQPIASMVVYVDGVKRYLVYANSLDTYLSMSPGSHTVAIKAWDSAGTSYQSSVGIKVR